MRVHVLKQWESWPLTKIDHLAIQTWITGLGERLSPATVAECRRLTAAVLRSAVRNRLIAYNPCEDIRVPKRRKQDTDEQVIARDVFRHKLLPVVPDRYRGLVAVRRRRRLAGRGVRAVRRRGRPGCRPATGDPHGRRGRRPHPVQGLPEVHCRPAHRSFAWLARRDPPGAHRAVCGYGEADLLFANPGRRRAPADAVPRSALAAVAGPGRAAQLGHPRRRTVGRGLDRRPEQARTELYPTEDAAVIQVARRHVGGLRYRDLRHSYATWLVDDGVPPNMVQRVMATNEPRPRSTATRPLHPANRRRPTHATGPRRCRLTRP